MLIEGLKFDLRIYVLVAGCDPLRLFVHKDGLTRFATVDYRVPSKKNMTNLQMHLTNYAINKTNPEFQQPENVAEDSVGHKRTLESTYAYLEENGYDVAKLKKRINAMIIKTLCAV
jgi:tubulin polyglutamylase TTLL6/13